MAIQMLAAWNGYEQHAVYTLSNAEETRLIGLGLARNYTGSVVPPGVRGDAVVFADNTLGYRDDANGGAASTISPGSGSVAVNPATGRIEDAVQRGAVAEVSFVSLAQSLDEIIVGTITRDANGAAISATLAWPDGGTGVYAATQVSTAFPGAVDAYTCTYVLGGVTRTFTQPPVTRDSNGAVINKPAMVVTGG